ncbi:MAG: nucleotidyltransferase domain-containing protein [Promethearchaeota archaeon]
MSKNQIGLTGSIMIGLDKSDSDIDIIIYGTETSLKFQEKLKFLFERSNKIRMYNLKEFKSHYSWRVGGSDISFEDFMKSEQRKLHQGKYENHDFFIRYIKSPEDWNGDFYDYQYKNYGRISLKANIRDSEDSIFTPCSYKIEPLKVLDEKSVLNKVKLSNILEINSFRARFCEHAKDGETVLVEGKLEKVIYKNRFEYYRVLLTDQTKDRMIIIN